MVTMVNLASYSLPVAGGLPTLDVVAVLGIGQVAVVSTEKRQGPLAEAHTTQCIAGYQVAGVTVLLVL